MEVQAPAVPVAPIIAAPVAPVVPAPINLRNRLAVRAALLSGTAAFFLSIPFGAFALLGMAAGGTLAVWVYRRGSGQALSMANGARLGWITGVFLFALALVNFTITVALDPQYFDRVRDEVMKRSALPEAEVRQVAELLVSPLGVGGIVFAMFVAFTLAPTLGGAVGAKLFDRR
jgi:hypothetical protein